MLSKIFRIINAAALVTLVAAITLAAPGRALSQGSFVADSGFRPEVDGFKFENYGAGFQDLTPADVQRLFGDGVCASLADGKCILTPPGQQWMEYINKGMNGGHCEGFAALSLVFYMQKQNPNEFGGGRVYDLNLQGNEKLQREIALYWATQTTSPANAGEIKGTPNEILDILINSLKPGAPETYSFGLFKPDMTGGHANTPYAVQDLGGGKFAVKIYENNFPGAPLEMIIDSNANTWSYQATTNPNEPSSLYTGDANTRTLSLTPTTPRLGKQNCPFCESGGTGDAGRSGVAQAVTKYNQIWLDRDPQGKTHLLITDEQGRRLGYVNGKVVSEIPGASFRVIRGKDLWKDTEEPLYFVPTGIKFTITVDATDVVGDETVDVTMIGPGYDLSAEEITLDKGQKDTITFSPDGSSISYKTDYAESPDLIIGFESKGADYSFLVKGADIEPGGTMNINLDKAKGALKIFGTGQKATSTYAFIMGRIDDKGETYFGHDDIQLEPKDSAIFDYTKWTSNGATMPMGIDRNSDGLIDETIQLSDEDSVTASAAGAATSNTLWWWVGGAVVLVLLVGGGAVVMMRRKK